MTTQRRPAVLVVEAGILWNRPGYVAREGDVLVGRSAGQEIRAYLAGEQVEEPYICDADTLPGGVA